MSSFAGLWLLHTCTHLWYVCADRGGKLVTLFLIGVEIPSFFTLSATPPGECWLIVLRVLMTPQPSTSPHIYTYIVCYKTSTSALCGLWRSTDNSQFIFSARLQPLTGSARLCTRAAGLRRPGGRIYLVPSFSQLVPCPCGAAAPSPASA